MASWRALRFGLLVLGLLFLMPIATWIATQSPPAAGWLGMLLGEPMVGLLGGVGATVVTATAFVALSVTTLGWNPLRSVGRGVIVGGDAAGRTVKAVADRSREAAAQALAEQPERQLVEDAAPLEGMEPEWAKDDGASGASSEGAEDAVAEADMPDAGATDLTRDDESADEPAADRPQDFASEDSEPDVGYGQEADLPDDDGLVDPNAGLLMEHEVPPVDLLSAPVTHDRTSMERQLDALGQVLVEKLGTFNIKSSLGGRTTGPVVTQFEVIPAPGVKVNRIANLDADLALAMKARTIRIVAPIPGKGAVGVEIPNPTPEIVNLREVLEGPGLPSGQGGTPTRAREGPERQAVRCRSGEDAARADRGRDGAGKSVCLNTIVTSLVYRHTPETLRLLMIDPKMVELSVYSRLPHLRHNVVTDPRDAAGVLKWAVIEMERRYALLKANYVRSIGEFNKKVREGQILRRSEPKGPEGDEDRWIYAEGIMPFIVVVVDELADLMMTVQSEVEKPLTQLAQKARAIGIHLIVATQRPSVNVITGLIKANFPTRIAFRVASKTDSRTILDQNGADALLGNGDMLFLPPGGSIPVRIQGAFLPTEDTERLMGWYVELLERHAEETGQLLETPDESDILEEVRGAELEEERVRTGRDQGRLGYPLRECRRGLYPEWHRVDVSPAAEAGHRVRSSSTHRGSAPRRRRPWPSEGSKGREVLMMMDELNQFMSGG